MELGMPLLWASVLLPIIIGLIAWITNVKGRLVQIIAGLSAASLALPGIIVVALYQLGALKEGVLDPVYFDLRDRGVGVIALVVDGLSAPVVLGVSLVTAAVAIYSIKYMTHRIHEMESAGEEVPGMGTYFFLYNTFAAAMLGLAFSTNLVEFYVFLELTLIPSFLLIAYWGYGDRRRIALLYFVWTHIGAVLFLTGLLYYGVRLGTFDYIVVPRLEPLGAVEGILGAVAKAVAALFVVGLFVKMAVFGVHMWLPYAHAEAPTPVSALLSPNLIGLAGYALARIVVPAFPSILLGWRDYLVMLAFLTIIYGGLVALRQADFKRFLAYSSVSQMGYLLLGIATLTAYGIGGAMVHYLVHAIGKAILFMVAGLFIAELHGLRDINKMGGLARLYPLTAAFALFGFMNLVGMPPSPGLWSEWLIVLGAAQVYSGGYGELLALAAALIVALGVSGAYSFIAMRRIFYGHPRSEIKAREHRDSMLLSIYILVLAGLVIFIASGPMVDALRVATYKLVGVGG